MNNWNMYAVQMKRISSKIVFEDNDLTVKRNRWISTVEDAIQLCAAAYIEISPTTVTRHLD